MSLAKKYHYRRRPPLSDYHKREDWAQYDYSGEYSLDDYHYPHRFHNMDYDERNYWPSSLNEEDFAYHDPESFDEDNFITNDDLNPLSRPAPRRRRLYHIDSESLHDNRRRMRSGPAYYEDKYYYHPHGEHENAWDEEEGDYSYDYYESYPRYGNISREEARFRRSDHFPQGGFDRKQREQGLRRRGERPSIRDKRY